MKKILIIEDKYDIVDGLKDLLNENGFEVLFSQFAHEGISLARKQKPDLVISDIMMPGMDGFQVLETLQHFDETKNIPVIFLSATADKSQIERGYDAGIKDYIVKPYRLTDFLTRVNKVLGE